MNHLRFCGLGTVGVIASLAISGLGQVPEGPSTTPADPAALQAAERASYDSGWRQKIGDPPPANAAAFIHEMIESDKSKTRLGGVEHWKNALQLRPGNPGNIVIEFKIAIVLSQTVDPGSNEPPDFQAALPYFQHIVEFYDHKSYYHAFMPGDGSDSPELKVPFAAELLSAYTADAAKAEAYLTLAMDDLYWTFKTRQRDWESAPRPSAEPSPFGGLNDTPARRLAAWEKMQSDARAGKAVGPYEKTLAEAVMRQFVGRHPEGLQPALQGIIDKYPESPLATAAAEQLVKITLIPPEAPAPAEVQTLPPSPAAAAHAQSPGPTPGAWPVVVPAIIGGSTIVLVILLLRTPKKKRVS